VSSIEGSGFSQIQRLFQIRIKSDADLLQAISEAVSAEGISAGVFVSGLGALKKAIFRNLKVFPENYPVTNEDRLYLEVTSPMELVSLTGWIAPKAGSGVEVHAHFAASTVQDQTVATMGGHLTEGTICGIKCVIAILVIEGDSVHSNQDEKTKTYDLFFRP
jgi:predicted DNA-binding protein with PD1-like motif